ncbi:MAG: hypothetical protein QG669_49 [Patescibacteria group bacterium]|nr:hypothetical protein [Patescibacteria group bacterium]
MRKTKNGAKRKRQKTDRMKFATLRRRLKKHKMYEMSPASALKYMIESGALPPDATRIPETFDQVSFKRKINGLTLVVHTSFNPTLVGDDVKKKANGLFAKKGGAIWILILDENRKRIFTRKRYRTATFADRIPLEVEFLVNRLKSRPEFPDEVMGGRYDATIAELKNETCWVSPANNIYRQNFFMFGVPAHLRSFVRSLEYSRKYYRNHTRERKGVRRTENEIRKKWKPSNVLRRVA